MGSFELLHSLPEISVVLPVYNHGSMLANAIESVLAQASSCKLELIIVNDGSTDTTEEVLTSYANHPLITVLTQSNKGIANALNRGFQESRGCFLTWTSADNLYQRDALGMMRDFLRQRPDLDMVYANVQLIDEYAKPLRTSSYRSGDQSADDPSILLLPRAARSLASFPDNFINACFMYRRSVFQKVGLYSSDLLGCEDYDYWLRASLCAHISHIDTSAPLYLYRIHDNSLTANLSDSHLYKMQESILSRANDGQKLVEQYGTISVPTNAKSLRPYFVQSEVKATLWSKSDEITCRDEQLNEHGLAFEFVESSSDWAAFNSFLEDDEWPGLLRFRVASHSAADPFYTFPPLSLPTALYRARDSNFNAITANDAHPNTALLLPDTDNALVSCNDTLVSFAERTRSTVALFCVTESQRQSADHFYVQNGHPSWLRIIDCTASKDLPHFNPQSQYASLLYAISSAQMLVSLSHEDSSASCLHISALIAAYAAKPLCVLGDDAPFAEAPVVGSFLREYLETAPHIFHHLHSAMPAPSIVQYDQWISRFSREEFHRQILGMLLANRVQPSE